MYTFILCIILTLYCSVIFKIHANALLVKQFKLFYFNFIKTRMFNLLFFLKHNCYLRNLLHISTWRISMVNKLMSHSSRQNEETF